MNEWAIRVFDPDGACRGTFRGDTLTEALEAASVLRLVDEARRGLASLIPPIELPPLPEPMVRAPAPGTRTPQPLCGWCLVPPGQPPSFPVRWWYECDCKMARPEHPGAFTRSFLS